MDRPTFSQSWSRVNLLMPMLRPQVQILRRNFRGQAWYVVTDPMTNSFFRLNPVAFHFVGLLDGKRTVDEVWKLTLDKYGDEAPTQSEVIGLLSQLNQANLLRIDLPPDAEPLLQRQRQKQYRRWAGQAMSVMFLQIPLFNPDRLLCKALPLIRPLLSRWALIGWFIWLITAASIFLPHLSQFIRDTGSILAPANWGWMLLLYVIIKIIHEAGHGLICRRFGGPVHEAGVMLLVLFPSPYMDTTSSWSFDSKWKRMLVGAGGMMFELTIAAGAAIFWVYSEPETLGRQLAHNVVIIASVATIIFNANPLMRFDGYFILSDVMEVPNLYERSTKQLIWLAHRFLYDIRSAQPVSSQNSERLFLTIYGIAAAFYRVLVMFGISLYIAGWAFTLGILLAIWTVGSWLVIPTFKFTYWLATSSMLYRKRTRAIGLTLAILLTLVTIFGLIPVNEYRRTQGVVESTLRADVVAGSDGFVKEVKAEVGDDVVEGQPLLILENPQLIAKEKELSAKLQAITIARRNAMIGKPSDIKAAEAQITAIQTELNEARDRINHLIVCAPRAGRLAGTVLSNLQGQYLKKGKTFARVEDMHSLRVTALVDQAQNDLNFLNNVRAVEVRSVGMRSDTYTTRMQKYFDSGKQKLPHPALGTHGGGIVTTDPEDKQGETTLRPQFTIWLDLPMTKDQADMPIAYPGQRVYVRFTLENRRPWIFQWFHRLRQVVRDRLATV